MISIEDVKFEFVSLSYFLSEYLEDNKSDKEKILKFIEQLKKEL